MVQIGKPGEFCTRRDETNWNNEVPEKFAPTEGWGKMAEVEICSSHANSIRMGLDTQFRTPPERQVSFGLPARRPVFPLSIVELTFVRIDHETICRWALT
jgi:hypothetical protein